MPEELPEGFAGMARYALVFAVIGLILNSYGTVAQASDSARAQLTVKLNGYIGRAESDVVVRMRVERDERARELLVEWEGDDLSGGSHVITLDGARAAVSHQYAIKRLAEGNYVVRATLRFSDGTETQKQVNVIMVGAEGSPSTMGLGERGASRH